MSLKNLATHLQAHGFGTAGTDLFVSHAIEGRQEGITLRQSGGPIDPELPGVRRLTFQAVFRGADYAATLDLAERASRALIIRQATIGDAFFYEVNPEHEPVPFGRDDSGVYSFIVNFGAVWRPSST